MLCTKIKRSQNKRGLKLKGARIEWGQNNRGPKFRGLSYEHSTIETI